MSMFTVGSLFSGIGGLDLGLEQTGRFHIAWQVEQDPLRQAVLAAHWPDVPRYGDIRTVSADTLSADGFSSVDVLAGGFPCQDVSLSNTHNPQGLDGARSGLWAEFSRLICQLRPRYVIVENVSALLVRGRGMGRVLADLASIGYDAEWQVLQACDFGAPHLRKRVFIVAYPYQERWAARLCLNPSDVRSLYPLWQTSDPVDDVWSRLSQLEARLGEPSVCSSYDGVSRRLERQLAAYGDAIVPQVACYIGACIVAYEDAHRQEVPHG